MGLIRVISEGMTLFGYQCPSCGRKELHDTELHESELICANCGDVMKSTTIKKEPEPKPKEPKVNNDIFPTAASCRNYASALKSSFRMGDEILPGYKCRRDNRTHSPDGICTSYKRRGGRKPKK